MNLFGRNFALWAVIILLVVALYQLFQSPGRPFESLHHGFRHRPEVLKCSYLAVDDCCDRLADARSRSAAAKAWASRSRCTSRSTSGAGSTGTSTTCRGGGSGAGALATTAAGTGIEAMAGDAVLPGFAARTELGVPRNASVHVINPVGR